MTAVPPGVVDAAAHARRVVVLTGAGVSAESGLATYRDAQTGLWSREDPMTLATPAAWEADPAKVWAWYRWRRTVMSRAKPNPGHRALAVWAQRPQTEVQVVTQNVDDLHERAGSDVLCHLHGSIFAQRCSECAADAVDDSPDLEHEVGRIEPPRCRQCGGHVRPDVVWFGEPLPQEAFQRAEAACRRADLVLTVGTSSSVYPAADLPLAALEEGVPVVEINPETTEFSASATHVWHARSGEALPALLAAVES